MMTPGYIILRNTHDMYKGNNTKNNSTRKNNAEDGMEGDTCSGILQIIIKCMTYRMLNNSINPFEKIYLIYIRLTHWCRNESPNPTKTPELLTQEIEINRSF